MYTKRFFQEEDKTAKSAAKIIVKIINSVFKPKSIVDVGCGTGAFLKQFPKNSKLLGIDGEYAKPYFSGDKNSFLSMNLNSPKRLDSRFDIAISLEVAEHLLPNSADKFIKFLTTLSDIVIFSAAIPGQGGTDHINEQWPSYWIKKFKKHKYEAYDLIRPEIWNNKKIPYWYKQNIIVFSKKKLNCSIKPLDIIHPEMAKSMLFRKTIIGKIYMLIPNNSKLILRNIFNKLP